MSDENPQKPEKPSIACAKDGPYVVKDLTNLHDSQGNPLPVKPSIALCRCGASAKKPFCDGTHKRIDFSDDRIADGSDDRRDDYVGDDITIHDNRGICAHAGFCTDLLPSVWRQREEPWIHPEAAPIETIVQTLKRCPSGALSHTIDRIERRDQDREPTITVSKNGPFWITGGVRLPHANWGQGASLEHYALCRCGASKNKPFCDGSHWSVGFEDDQTDGTGAAAAPAPRTWLRVAGPDELADGEVRGVSAGTRTIALSRVGEAYGALDAACPHQGGPLGEGTIEAGQLRCPWHGWSFDPISGVCPDKTEGATRYGVELREDGVYVEVEADAARVRSVSDVMIETLVKWGVTHIFGMVGHSNLGVADAIRVQAEAGKLSFIGVRHEGAAAFACSGFAKLSGRPAACLSIAGPGATNLLTGLWDAKVDRAPVLALTGQINSQVLGPGAFQEIDHAAAFSAVANWSQSVLPESNHAELMSLALKHAIVDRAVSHLIFPDEVQARPAPDGAAASGPEGRLGEVEILPARKSLGKALSLIARSMRPAVLVGYGARGSMPAVIKLAERLKAPVLTTFKAKGQIADRHALAAGVLGRSGTPIASRFMNQADLLIVLGASFADHTGIEPRKPTIQVDFERMALGKRHPVDVPLWGEIGVTAELLEEKLPAELPCVDQRQELATEWQSWREEKKRRAAEDRGRGLASAAVFERLSKLAPQNAAIAVDVGNNTYSFGRYFECRSGQSVLMSGYLGSIGFAFPAAMGAWAAAPDRPILSISGDGGFGQYLAELTTAVKHGMNITHVLLNNNELGKISKEQRAAQQPVWETGLHNPNFADYAKLCGAHGVRVTRVEELEAAITGALEHAGPALVEVMTDSELV